MSMSKPPPATRTAGLDDPVTRMFTSVLAQPDMMSFGAGSRDPAGFDVVVNATPLGMKEGDPLPLDVSRISPAAFVGEVVMKQEITPFLAAAKARGCEIQVGTDMLFEQIPAYLEFFGFGTTTPDELRAVAQINY